MASFQKAYLTINPDMSKDTNVLQNSLKNLVFGKKSNGSMSPFNMKQRASPFMSQKTQKKNDNNLDVSLASAIGGLKLAPPSTNEIIIKSRLVVVEKMNENISEDDEAYNDETLFIDPSIQNTNQPQ